MRWTNIEIIIQSEVSPTEKDKYCILIHIYGIRKMVLMNLFAGQQRRSRHREQTYGHRGGEEREGKMCGETNMETYNTICKIDSQWEFAVSLRELLYQTGSVII